MAVTASQAQASLYLDTRREKKDGTFPIKIYVWNANRNQGKHYSTRISLKKAQFQSVWESDKPRLEHKNLRIKLQALLSRAEEIISGLDPFTFDAYERKALLNDGDAQDVFRQYENTIAKLRSAGRISTANNYRYSLKSLQTFHKDSILTFDRITPEWLERFEDHLIKAGKSETTVGIYLRPLKAIFNSAIESNDISREYYPFGRRRYSIPSGGGTKRALSSDQMKKLFHAEPKTVEQEKARDFFIFSYVSNGMNMKDISLLKFKDFGEDTFHFVRAKTKLTKKHKQTIVKVYLTDIHHQIISKHGNRAVESEFVFPIIKNEDSPEEQHRSIKNFTRLTNQHLKKLCKQLELPPISTYWARHSFATIGINKDIDMDQMRELLGHSDIKTTIAYFGGFDDEKMKERIQSIMEF